MSAGAFPPTSSRSTKPRTSTRTPEFAGYADSMKERCSSGSAPAFCYGGGAGRIASLVPGGRGSFSQGGSGGDGSPGGEEPAESRMGRPDRPGANGAFACPGPYVPPSPALLLPRARAASRPSPRCFWPRAHLCVHAPPPSSLSSALPRMRPGRPKTAFACGVPGALRGTWVSPTRFDEDERPVSRERLDMRGTHSYEASSWARGYYAE